MNKKNVFILSENLYSLTKNDYFCELEVFTQKNSLRYGNMVVVNGCHTANSMDYCNDNKFNICNTNDYDFRGNGFQRRFLW